MWYLHCSSLPPQKKSALCRLYIYCRHAPTIPSNGINLMAATSGICRFRWQREGIIGNICHATSIWSIDRCRRQSSCTALYACQGLTPPGRALGHDNTTSLLLTGSCTGTCQNGVQACSRRASPEINSRRSCLNV